ncbi:cytochrome c oxidase subunit 6A1, mitochondrial [Drosophila grimshawi]|uniref:GH22053 n=1 Tax=Drosophila grimshawi TaxID=7222 RepID=B4J9N4_DROGR|nr:cytochrome c oxidase subunit 6A1, mitochondrial [Drosophila grimshawi]EDW02541.1 GH22053 [Drosophila grimshawi]
MSLVWERYLRPCFNQIRRSLNLIGGKTTGSLVWKRVTFLVATPAVALCMINAYNTKQDGEKAREPFVKYEHLRRRNKRFPWGNGERSLFHNSNKNALTDGYEV